MSTTQFFNNGSALYNNGRVAISKDLVFGLSVYTEGGWRQLKGLEAQDIMHVRHLIDNDPLFAWWDMIEEAINTRRMEKDNPVVIPEPVPEVVYKSWAEVEAMTAMEYLEYREEDYAKLSKENFRNMDDGSMEFFNGDCVYAKADVCTVGGLTTYFDLYSNSGKLIQKKMTRGEVFAKILKVFW